MPIPGVSNPASLASDSRGVSIGGSVARAARAIQRTSRTTCGGAKAAHDHAVNGGMHYTTAASVTDDLPTSARNAVQANRCSIAASRASSSVRLRCRRAGATSAHSAAAKGSA